MPVIFDESGFPLLDEAGGYILDEAGLAFPAIPLDVRAELQLGGTWTDVSAYLDHKPVSIGRGHPDESTTTSPSTLAMTLTNSAGQFSPNNPSGPYYPYIAQNVPCRISIPAQGNYLRTEVDAASGASCPDVAPLRITGDLDVRLDVRLTDSGPVGLASSIAVGIFQFSGYLLAGNWGASGTWGWLLTITGAGNLVLWWSPDGVTVTGATLAISTVPLPRGRQCLRATLQLSTGTVTFYTGPAGGAGGSTWTQLGSAVVTGATALHGGTSGISTGPYYGSTYEMEVRSGIGGVVIAHPVFSAQAAGATSFSDGLGNTWTLSGTAEISSRSYRGHFEIGSFPRSQDPTGKTVTVAAVGGGLLRRKGQGQNPTASAMTRAYTRPGTGIPAPVAYIPMEDGGNATSLASGIGGPAATFTAGLQLAQNSSFACSNPLPQVNGSIITIPVPAYKGGSANVLRFLWTAAAGAVTAGTVIARMSTIGTVAWADLVYSAAGSLELNVYSALGALLGTTGSFAVAGLDGGLWLIEMSLFNSSGSVGFNLAAMLAGSVNATSSGGTVSGSIGNTTSVVFNPTGALSAATVGQAAIQASYTTGQLSAYAGALTANAGEPAGQRFRRLCMEEAIPFRGQGNLAATMLMGTQTPQTITALLQECADADRGIWTELRQQLGWGYVTRSALYNQPVQVALDYDQDHLSPWSSNPTRDDQTIGNDITLTQSGDGTTARQFAAPGQPISGGRLSVLPPPQGCGTYDGKSATVNLFNDSDMATLASWMVHLGTVDEDRYPGIVIDLANAGLGALFWSVLDMDLGARLTIANPPAWLQPNQVSQLAQQITEDLWADTLMVTVAGVPESPYEVAQDGAGFHLDTDGSALVRAVGTGDVTLFAAPAVAGAPGWTTSGGDFPFDVMISGERVTVTAIGNPFLLSLGTADGTMESGVSQWAPSDGTVVQSNAHAHGGTFSALVTCSASPPGQVTLRNFFSGAHATPVPVVPGVSYEAVMWILDGTGRTYAAAIDWLTAGGTRVSTSSGATATSTASFTSYSVTDTAPAGAAFAIYGPTLATPAPSAQFYVDDIVFGAAAAQTFTCTRSVNGVSKAQAVGAPVSVYPPPTAAL